MAAVLWLTRLIFVSFNILFGVLLVVMNTDSCVSVFETQVDHVLVGHVTFKAFVADELECQLKCLENNTCKSFNVHPSADNNAKRVCELNNKTQQMKPDDFKRKKGSNYYGSVEVSGINVSHDRNGQSMNSSQCHPGYKEKRCQTRIHLPAHCKDIRDSGNSKGNGKCWNDPEKSGNPLKVYCGMTTDGEIHLPAHCKDIRDSGNSKGNGRYWIDPEKSGNSLEVYCDMITDGGGWLLISNIVIQNSTLSSPVQLPAKTSYRGISSDQMVLQTNATKELFTHYPFTQLRFHCSKRDGPRTFHVITAANSSGEAVVRYFSGQTDVMPDSCGSFVRMEDDNSMLARNCTEWGYHDGSYGIGKWGHGKDQKRLYEFPALEAFAYHWMLEPLNQWGVRYECDDTMVSGVPSIGDFWKVFVR